MTFICPSHAQQRPSDLTLDHWRTESDGTRTCSYCGSLHEEDFQDILAHYVAGDEGYKFDASMKTYKCYANRPGTGNASMGGIKFYLWHVDTKHPDIKAREEMHKRAVAKFNQELQRLWKKK